MLDHHRPEASGPASAPPRLPRARGSLLGLGALASALLLAGCSHLPSAVRGPLEPWAASGLDSDRGAGEPRDLAGAGGAQNGAAAAPIHAEDFDDLLERMRWGFGLPQVDEDSIADQLTWYRNHPAYLDRTLSRGRRYLHHIVEALEDRGMPRELALLPIVESGFDPFAYSRCRAAGLWQFIPSTGQLFGLDRSWWYEGRRDVLEATRAALDYLQELHDEFDGDWLLAVAAYNAGAPAVERAVARNQREGLPTDFFHLDLPRETRAYVPGLLAVSRVVAHPAAYGLELPAIPNQPYFARVEVGYQIDLAVLADRAGVSRDELLALNPGFNRWATAPDGPHRVLVPVAAEARFETALAGLSPGDRLRFAHHRVAKGDTLRGISRRYAVSIDVLRAVNRVRGNVVPLGQDLLIPLSYRPTRLLPHEPTLQPATLAQASGARGSAWTYTVRRGDTLDDVSQRFRVSVADLVDWNRLSDADRLLPGQRLVISPHISARP
jgi:membrane-bound lytic murein transglycosylase D